MYASGLNKLFWGFFFMLIDFRIQGFDILPDIIGYVFLYFGINNLISKSDFFDKASKYCIFMLIASLFSIYQFPAMQGGLSFGTFGLLGIFSIILGIISFVINLLLVYNIFMGINVMAGNAEKYDLMYEAERMWGQYRTLQIALITAFVLAIIPPLVFVYIIVIFIATIVVTINILSFLKRCSDSLGLVE